MECEKLLVKRVMLLDGKGGKWCRKFFTYSESLLGIREQIILGYWLVEPHLSIRILVFKDRLLIERSAYHERTQGWKFEGSKDSNIHSYYSAHCTFCRTEGLPKFPAASKNKSDLY